MIFPQPSDCHMRLPRHLCLQHDEEWEDHLLLPQRHRLHGQEPEERLRASHLLHLHSCPRPRQRARHVRRRDRSRPSQQRTSGPACWQGWCWFFRGPRLASLHPRPDHRLLRLHQVQEDQVWTRGEEFLCTLILCWLEKKFQIRIRFTKKVYTIPIGKGSVSEEHLVEFRQVELHYILSAISQQNVIFFFAGRFQRWQLGPW